jgi:hypothetical protein
MKTITALLSFSALVLSCEYAIAQHNHDEDLRSDNIVRRTSYVSEEVAIQKLKSMGVTQIEELREVDGRFLAKGVHQGRTMNLEVDRQTGYFRERGKFDTLVSPSKMERRQLSDYTLRSDIARPRAMMEPLLPERPTTIKPILERPPEDRPRETPPS